MFEFQWEFNADSVNESGYLELFLDLVLREISFQHEFCLATLARQ